MYTQKKVHREHRLLRAPALSRMDVQLVNVRQGGTGDKLPCSHLARTQPLTCLVLSHYRAARGATRNISITRFTGSYPLGLVAGTLDEAAL